MAHSPGKTSKYADFENLRAQAVALRRQGMSLRQIRDHLKIHNNDLREQARELRLQGWTHNEIQAELGCSKSSVSLWVRDLPRPEPKCSPEEQRARMNAGLTRLRTAQDQDRTATKQAAADAIGALTKRELFIAGVALYWAEGAKDKPHRRSEVLQFINSDPNVIRLFLRWLDLLEVPRSRLTLRVSIHETADVGSAENFWADVVGVDVAAFSRATMKKHNPRTVRKNTGDTYRGCLVIYVRQSADLYRRMEGTWYGIVGAASAVDLANRT
ncbi:terminase gpP N-terminus-related DNA-binding protein [Streptomyces bauhiniae]|uniref:Terminase ATPase subunit N-terminal domain-containing protein n=1 Tax=Streptomyces bauhiniae TaxID=2340725 RepID=A0A7K3QNL7_9ACTN|nr:hypothetical protein [Streptomyces bauhiniae]NEB91499.1 hypothetical protein [Streptomyces bauhiniae]